jgi:hypothetical protein
MTRPGSPSRGAIDTSVNILPFGCACACQLTLPQRTTAVTLTFGLQRRRIIEVLAQPTTTTPAR